MLVGHIIKSKYCPVGIYPCLFVRSSVCVYTIIEQLINRCCFVDRLCAVSEQTYQLSNYTVAAGRCWCWCWWRLMTRARLHKAAMGEAARGTGSVRNRNKSLALRVRVSNDVPTRAQAASVRVAVAVHLSRRAMSSAQSTAYATGGHHLHCDCERRLVLLPCSLCCCPVLRWLGPRRRALVRAGALLLRATYAMPVGGTSIICTQQAQALRVLCTLYVVYLAPVTYEHE